MSKLDPWIERVILGYGDGTQQQNDTRRLKAHVVGLGEMSASEAQASQQETTELIFLSDGQVQIAAVLTASAREDLLDREDRECSSGLMDATVHLMSYTLDFTMKTQVPECRFFLSVSKMATVAAGPPKPRPPPCTTLFSVRQQIYKTWRLLESRRHSAPGGGPQNSQQRVQCGFDLSHLLGAWDKDALRNVQADVVRALQTSSRDPPTSWEAHRVARKSEETFHVPVCHLLLPPEEPPQGGSETPSGGILSRPCLAPLSTSTTSGSTAGPFYGSLLHRLSPFPHNRNGCSQICSKISTHPLPLSGQENMQPCVAVESLTGTHQEEVQGRKRKRKLHHCNADASPSCEEEEEEEVHASHRSRRRSLPSWLFDRQQEEEGSGGVADPEQTQPTAEAAESTAHHVHHDGTPFQYAYEPGPRQQLLLDLSRFMVPDSLLQWATRYLKTDG